jgi:hypothetical protein
MEQAFFLTGCPPLGALHPNPRATNAIEERCNKEKLMMMMKVGEGMGNPEISAAIPTTLQ